MNDDIRIQRKYFFKGITQLFITGVLVVVFLGLAMLGAFEGNVFFDFGWIIMLIPGVLGIENLRKSSSLSKVIKNGNSIVPMKTKKESIYNGIALIFFGIVFIIIPVSFWGSGGLLLFGFLGLTFIIVGLTILISGLWGLRRKTYEQKI